MNSVGNLLTIMIDSDIDNTIDRSHTNTTSASNDSKSIGSTSASTGVLHYDMNSGLVDASVGLYLSNMDSSIMLSPQPSIELNDGTDYICTTECDDQRPSAPSHVTIIGSPSFIETTKKLSKPRGRKTVTPLKSISQQSHRGREGRQLKYKRRCCRISGCERTVKSQGVCQRHGAKAKNCRVTGCDKLAQGSFDGMCKSHYKETHEEQEFYLLMRHHDGDGSPSLRKSEKLITEATDYPRHSASTTSSAGYQPQLSLVPEHDCRTSGTGSPNVTVENVMDRHTAYFNSQQYDQQQQHQLVQYESLTFDGPAMSSIPLHKNAMSPMGLVTAVQMPTLPFYSSHQLSYDNPSIQMYPHSSPAIPAPTPYRCIPTNDDHRPNECNNYTGNPQNYRYIDFTQHSVPPQQLLRQQHPQLLQQTNGSQYAFPSSGGWNPYIDPTSFSNKVPGGTTPNDRIVPPAIVTINSMSTTMSTHDRCEVFQSHSPPTFTIPPMTNQPTAFDQSGDWTTGR